MNCRDVRFSRHAIQRMFERSIPAGDVLITLDNGEVVEEYPDDSPYPSALLLGWSSGRPLHVAAAHDPERNLCVVITAYIPDTMQWGEDFKTRKTR
jgi:hypothetical protein